MKSSIVVFRDAFDAVAKYKQGRNARTLEIEWRRADFSRILKLQISHSIIDFTRRSRQMARLVPAAEAEWSGFLKQQIAERLALKLPIEFRLKRDGVISVSPGRVFITRKLQKTQLSIENRESIDLRRGFFSVASKEAGFLTNRGRMTFLYSDLGNANVFLSVVDLYLS